MNELEITLKQAESLVEWFGGDEDLVLTLVEGDETFHFGKGLYARNDYAEHGFYFLGDSDGS